MIEDTETSPNVLSVDNQVTASDAAQVGQQIGIQVVDSVVHSQMFYTVRAGDPPDRRHRVARAHLDGGDPRQAEELLDNLLTNRYVTTERAYLYVLSVLSDRVFTDITADQTRKIAIAIGLAAEFRRDEWQEALEVVDKLLHYAHREFGEGAAEQELASALEQFHTLSMDRQDEIDRHLNLILSGAVQERLTGERKCRVAEERMSGDRVGRAWKFFEADPRPPTKWLILPIPSTASDWRDAVFGSAAAISAIAILLIGEITTSTVVGVVLLAAGGYLATRWTTVWQTHVRQGESVRENCQPEPGREEWKFDRLVDQCFRDYGPGGPWEMTAEYREFLKRRLQQQYGDDERHPGELKWLIMWHAVRAGHQYDYPSTQPPGADRAVSHRTVGAMVWVLVLTVVAGTGHFLALALAAGGWWGIRGIARIISVSRAWDLLDQEAEYLLEEEWEQYHRWLQILEDRPSDMEMAHWLALDKTHLKNDALQRANLSERDLVTHVVLTENAPFARKGRVIDGPPRYEAYLVYVFLLTRYGMRTTRTYLTLTTGEVRNEQRQMCTYDAVASASVMEKGVRTFEGDGRPAGENFTGRVFRLTLLNGTCIAEVKENARVTGEWTAAADGPMDPTFVQTAGFESALRVLEAVATEGRDWITRDRERKQRWARNWCTRPPSSAIARMRPTDGRAIMR